MIVVDLNLLLYACFDGFPRHAEARAWWEATLRAGHPVGLCGPVVFGFLRLATSRHVMAAPMTMRAAISCVEGWLALPNVEYLPASVRHVQVAIELLGAAGAAAQLTTDAQIAAHARLVGGKVFTHDIDFARFPNIVTVDPLAPSA